MCHLSRRMQERFEWIRNIFWHYFWKTHLVVIQWYALQWFEHPNNTAATERLTWIEWHWWYNESFHNLFNDLILIIRQNHRGSFSDPILSSGCSCVKPMLALPDPVPNVTFDVVFTSKKECDYFFWLMTVLQNAIIAELGSACVSMFFHVFPYFYLFIMFCTFFRSANIVEFSVFTPIFWLRKESSATARWMALERLKVDWEPKGCVGSTAFGCFQPGQGLNVNLKKHQKTCGI